MRRWLIMWMVMMASAGVAQAGTNGRTSVGGTVTVNEGETSGDIACVFCTVKVHGDVNGDIAVMLGSVSLDAGHSVKGDVAIFGGDLRMGEGATIGGDLALAGGNVRMPEGAAVKGDKAVLEGRGWMLLLLAPIAIVVGVIWLIVYLVRRLTYQPPPPPGYPVGRRY